MKRTVFSVFAGIVAVSSAFGGLRNEAFDLLLETGESAAVREGIRKIEDPPVQAYWRSKAAFYEGNYGAAEEAVKGISSARSDEEREFRSLERYYAALGAVTRDFSETSSEHFRFRCAGSDAILVPYALETLEAAYREIGADLGCFPAEKVVVEIYPAKEEFSLASTLAPEVLEKSGTVGICKFNRIMILSPRVLPLGFPWRDTLAHEYTHLLANRASRGRCPLWLHEGIARYHETRWRLKEPVVLTTAGENGLKKALEKKILVPFKRMHPSLVYLKDQDEISLAFAEVSSAVAFLKEEYGAGCVAELLAEIARSGEGAAFRKVTRRAVPAFEKAWHARLMSLPLKSAPGAVSDQAAFRQPAEDEFIGADARGEIRLGDQMRRIDRPEAAVVLYEKALEKEPANPVILLKIARADIALGRDDAAIEKLRTAIEKNAQYVTPYQVLGERYTARRDYDRAIETYTAALSINPFHPGTHRGLAVCYLARGNKELALREMKAAVDLDPDDFETRVLLDRMSR